MLTHTNKNHSPQTKVATNLPAANRHEDNTTSMLADNTPESRQLRQLQLMADNSPQAANAARLQAMAEGAPDSIAQLMGLEAPGERSCR